MKNNNIFISILVTIIIILVICILTLVFVNMGKSKKANVSSSESITESSEEISSSSMPEESSSSSQPEESSSEEIETNKQESLSITDSTTEYKDLIIEKDIIIDSKDLSSINLENIFVGGNIIVNNSYGSIYLKNIEVSGDIIINNFSGYEFGLIDTLANELRLVSVSKEYFPIISIAGKTQMNKALIYRGAILRQNEISDGYKGFSHIGIGGYKPRLWHDITLENIKDCYLTINFPANVNLKGNTDISQAYAYRQSHIYGTGSVQYLFIKTNNISYDKITGFVSNPDKFSIEKGGRLVNRETLNVDIAKPIQEDKKDDLEEKPDLPK